MHAFPPDEAQRLAVLVAARRPRVHVLTNAVAQVLTANALVAIGAEPSMSAHPKDVHTLVGGADAVLVNLGMLDVEREAAIELVLSALGNLACPVVLDPVMADRVPCRRALAERFSGYPRLIVKGNAAEMAALLPALPAHVHTVTTGERDRTGAAGSTFEIGGGHPLMARFSGSGCLTGAIIAAFAAVETDLARASAAALAILRLAAAKAGAQAGGPGTFVPLFLDALAVSPEV
jgi:hydroxyethylthiazole kinase